MLIASWNVNSIKVRLPHVLEWLHAHKPDVLALQETKATNENFPLDEIAAAGYHAEFDGQKTYNGVALLSKSKPTDVSKMPVLTNDAQKRFISARYGDLLVVNVYVPNGNEVGSEKFEYKLQWLKKLGHYLKSHLHDINKIVVVGDFNIAPDDRDVYDPEQWREKILCSTPEREALQSILKLGFHDSYRLFEQTENGYSWWDYRAAAFQRNRGLRIDLALVSNTLQPLCTSSEIDTKPRSLERPSDHAPVYITLKRS